VPRGVVEDLLELLLPACRRVVGLGLLDPLAEEDVQGVPVGFGEPDRIFEQQVASSSLPRR
jgi:hypothetical protein